MYLKLRCLVLTSLRGVLVALRTHEQQVRVRFPAEVILVFTIGIHKSLFMTITRALCVTWWQRWDLISRQASLRLSISAWILSFFLATIISKLHLLQLGISFISNRAVNQHQQLGKERRRDDVSTLH